MLEVIKLFVRRMLMGKGKGILQIPPQKAVDDFANDLYKKFKQNGVSDEAVTNPNDVKAIWNQITNREAQIFTNNLKDALQKPDPFKKAGEVFDLKGKKIKNPQNIMGGEELPGEINIFSNKYLNDLDKKIIDSDAFGYSQKEWNNLSNSSKEKFRKQFDSNYADAMENTQMATLKEVETDAEILARLNKGNKESLSNMRYEKAVKAEEAKAAADEDYIMKVLDPEEFAEGGRTGYKDGLGPNNEIMGPVFTTNNVSDAIKEVLQRYVGTEPARIPFTKNTELMFDLKGMKAGGSKNLFGGELNFGYNKNFGRDDEGIGFEWKKSFAVGGQAKIEPSLSDIGHGSDALMARNALLTPGSQATTSTGLNYLLGEDNDTTRVPYGEGKDVKMILPKEKPMDEYMLKKLMSQAGAETLDARTRDMFIQEYKKKIREKNSKADGGPARQNFGIGGMSRRAFLKWMAGAGVATVGAAKSGLFSLLKGGASKKAAVDLVTTSNVAGKPVWFDALVNKVIREGDDVTKKFGTVDREIVHTKRINDLEEVTVTRELDTGDILVEYGPHMTDETGKVIRASNEPSVVRFQYKKGEEIYDTGKGHLSSRKSVKEPDTFNAIESEPQITDWDGTIEMDGERNVQNIDELLTDTNKLKQYATGKKPTIGELLKGSKKQKYKQTLEENPSEQINYIENKGGGYTSVDDMIDEGARVGDFEPRGYDVKGMNLPEKKADGGRVPLVGGGVLKGILALGKGATKKAGEGKFTKNEVLLNMFQNTIKQSKSPDTKKRFINFIEEIKLKPELSKDPNVWNFFTKGLPKNQKLVVYGDDTVDFWTQSEFGPHNIATSAKFQKKHPYLTKDQAVKIQNMEPEDQIFEMKRLETIRKRTANATGGRVPMVFGGGIYKAIIKNLAKARGVNPSEYLKVTNYKTLPSEVRNLMSKADFEKMKAGRIEMFENWVDMAKTRKEFLKNIEEGKKSPAAPIFENLEQSFKSPVPSSVTDKDILQGEFILKNLKTKNRKLHSSGGIAAMLGE